MVTKTIFQCAFKYMTKPYPSILFFGPPGSGKGTQAKFISDLTGHYHLSAGDIFREMDPETPLGKLQRDFSRKGLLIPDDAAVEIWKGYTENLVNHRRYKPNTQLLLTDGMPRTVQQSHSLRNSLMVRAVINLEVSDEECLISRLSARAVVQKREDDKNLETLRTRFLVYKEQSREVLQTFPQEIIISISAQQRPFEVLRDILNHTSQLLKYPN